MRSPENFILAQALDQFNVKFLHSMWPMICTIWHARILNLHRATGHPAGLRLTQPERIQYTVLSLKLIYSKTATETY
jgi:hypothetical protein